MREGEAPAEPKFWQVGSLANRQVYITGGSCSRSEKEALKSLGELGSIDEVEEKIFQE